MVGLGGGELRLLKGCFCLWVYLYMLVQLGTSSLWVFFGLAVLAGGTWLGLHRYSLPRGDDMLVKEVLGADPAHTPQSEEFVMNVVAHRFAGLDAPENTLAALEYCGLAGVKAVEFDVQLTADRVAIVFHDDELDRVSTETGFIASKTWGSIKTLDISVYHPFRERFSNSKIPKFEDVVKRCLDLDMRMFIDIKDSSNEMVEAVCGMYDKYPVLYRRSVVSSFNPLVIYKIRSRKPAIVGCMAWRPNYFSCKGYCGNQPSLDKPYASNPVIFYLSKLWDSVFTWLLHSLIYKVVGISAILIHKDAFSWERVNWWRCRDVRCFFWTVNYPWEKTFFVKNQVPILTDTLQASPSSLSS